MTDILDRPMPAASGPEPEPGAGPDRASLAPPPAAEPSEAPAAAGPTVLAASPVLRTAMAALALGAGAVHLAVAPAHLGEAGGLGWGLLLAGWLQIALGVAILARPGRLVLWIAVLTNAVLVGGWILSRTAGLPVDGARGAQKIGFVDLVTVGLELALVATACAVLAAGAGRRSTPYVRWVAPVFVILLASAALVSPSARTPEPATVEATAAPAAPTPTTVHDHGGGPTTTAGAAPTPSVLPGTGNAGAGGHAHAPATYAPLDATTQKTFSEQMAQTRAATMQYPTIADAKRAGLRPVGIFSAGSGAHYMVGNPVSRLAFDPGKPLMWLFAGNADTSPVVGVMYFSLAKTAPEGYAGNNDGWHQHTGLCIKPGANGIDLPLPIDTDATKQQCDEVGGQYMAETGWMIHVWSAPGWESPAGVFSHDNQLLVCSDGRKAGEVKLNEGCQGLD